MAELLTARRKELGYEKRLPFARANGLTHDRALSDLENARRTRFDQATLAQVEQIYRWISGSIENVLRGGSPVPYPPETVAPDSDDSGVLASLPAEAIEGLGAAERAEVVAAMKLEGLKTARAVRRRVNE